MPVHPDYRFTAQAHAVVFGGRIHRVEREPGAAADDKVVPDRNIVMEGGSCALPVSGGRSKSVARPTTAGLGNRDFLKVDGGTAEAWNESPPTDPFPLTGAKVTVDRVTVGVGPVLELRGAQVEISSKYGEKGPNFAVRVAQFDSLVLDGQYGLDVRFRTGPARSRTSLRPPFDRKDYERYDIVESLTWTNPANPFPGGVLHSSSAYIPNFGLLFFGELLTNRYTHRLTLLRLQLGSPMEADCAAAEVQSNGTW